jgi:hypothetical protein
MSEKLCLDLEKRVDEYGKIFYITKLKAPITIEAKDGLCILVFISEEGAEQLQICNMSSKKDANKK